MNAMDPCDDDDDEDRHSFWNEIAPHWSEIAPQVVRLANKKENAERAIALCMLMGAEIQNVQESNIYRAHYKGAVFGRWLYPARAAVAFCVAMKLDIET